MNEIIQQVQAILTKYHQDDPARGIDRQAQRITDEFLRKRSLETRQGAITNRDGVRVDLERELSIVLDADPWILPSPKGGNYVSPFERPNEQQRRQQISDTEKALKHLCKLRGIVPIDQAYFERAIGILSKNLLYEVTAEGEVLFGKYHPSGIIHQDRFNFDSVIQSVEHLIDRGQSSLAQELRESALKKQARELLPDKPKDADVKAKVEQLKRNEIISTIGRRIIPKIPRSEAEREIGRREAAIRGLNYTTLGGNNLAQINMAAKREYDSYSDMSNVAKELQELRPPLPKYEGLTYYGSER